jgi:hypothetical protein
MANRIAAWTARNAAGLLETAGLAGVFVGFLCSPHPWLAGVVVGGVVFGLVAWGRITGRIGGP